MSCFQCFYTVDWALEEHLSGVRCTLFACGPADDTAISKPYFLPH